MSPNFKKGFEKKAIVGLATKAFGGPLGALFAGWTAYEVGSRTRQAVKKPKGLNIPSSYYAVKV